jgi:hypothetical protein
MQRTDERQGVNIMSQIKAEQFRRLANECERQAELAAGEPMFREMQRRLAKSYQALAETEEWLDGLEEAAPAPRLLSREIVQAA